MSKRLADELSAVRLCPDEWLAGLGIDLHEADARDRLEGLFRQHAYSLLGLGQTVILEFGFWARVERDELRFRARVLGAAVELRYLDVPLDELLRRLEACNGAGAPDAAVITRNMIEQWAKDFDRPE